MTDDEKLAQVRKLECWRCGASTDVTIYRMNRGGKPGIWACDAHLNRTKCSIDGCTRSCKRDDGRPWEWICSVHWRRYCPPRSLRRRTYLAFFRRARKYGWNDKLAKQYWRFWDTLVRGANRLEALGYPDMKEINKMFGWTE